MSILSHILDLLFPPRCAFCAQILQAGEADGICAHCRAVLPRIPKEEQSLSGNFYSRCISPLYYREPVESSIRRYKFSGREWYIRVYGPILARTLEEQLPKGADLVTWAPLSALRFHQRGYDQARLLAVEAAACYGMKPVRLLKKVRHTRSQSSLSPAARKKNAEDAYRVIPGTDLTGKRVLLVDDVLTTGSTLSACALELVKAGASEVICLTLARSVSARDLP